MLGAADALQGDVGPALKQMEPSYEATFGYGFLGVLPGVILADALASADRNQEALALVTRLLDKSSTPEVGPFISELWRFRGEMVLRQSAINSQEAERFFGTALRIADKQGANVFRLRAGIPLARMLAEGGRREEAKTVLDHAAAIALDECSQADLDWGPHYPRQDIQAWQSLPAGSIRASGMGRACEGEARQVRLWAQAMDRGGQEAAASQRAGDRACQQARPHRLERSGSRPGLRGAEDGSGCEPIRLIPIPRQRQQRAEMRSPR